MILVIAPTVDISLQESQAPCLEIAYGILDEMAFRGNLQAGARKSEVLQLQQILNQLPSSFATREAIRQSIASQLEPVSSSLDSLTEADQRLQVNSRQTQYNPDFMDDSMWQNGFTADQLMMVADSLDLEGIDWMTMGSSTLND